MKQRGVEMTIYSDSRNAISWVKQKKCKTKLERNKKTEEVFNMIERAEKWLKENRYSNKIVKWETELWERSLLISEGNRNENKNRIYYNLFFNAGFSCTTETNIYAP